MSRNKSAKEVEKEHVDVMGPSLGPVYHALYNEVVWLHAKWLEYRKLFAHSPERINLLNDSSGFFFRVIQDVLWEDIILHIARLTDPPQSTGKKNLTLLKLPECIVDSGIVKNIESKIDTVRKNAAFARDWRNRRLAHRDLALALKSGSKQLQGVSRKNVESALHSIDQVLNYLHTHYFDGEVAFDQFIALGDAEALVYQLEIAMQAQNSHMNQR